MLYASRLSTTTLTRSLIRHESLVRLDHQDGLMLDSNESVAAVCLSQGHNDALLNSGTEPKTEPCGLQPRFYPDFAALPP